jgi:hypothetical protein
MSSGSLIDLDPPPARERRWPFYVGWMIGGSLVGAVLLSHLPVAFADALPFGAGADEPIVTAAPSPTVLPAAPIIQRGSQGPARPTSVPLPSVRR